MPTAGKPEQPITISHIAEVGTGVSGAGGKQLPPWRQPCLPPRYRRQASRTTGALDDDEFGAQGTGFFQRFENRDEVAGRRTDVVYRLDDAVE